MLVNYKSIAQPREKITKNCYPACNSCGLCGKHSGLKNMVIKKDKILTKFGNIIKLKNRLNCKNYGIYGAECKLCNELYIGQTKNRFSTRWNSHRSKWKILCKLKLIDKQENNRNSDEAALWCHYRKFHKNIILENLDLADAFGVLS